MIRLFGFVGWLAGCLIGWVIIGTVIFMIIDCMTTEPKAEETPMSYARL